MGAWDVNNFGNDTAMDWVWAFEEDPTLTFLNDTILAAIDDEFLDSDPASEALAALEVIAAIKQQPAADFPSELQSYDLAAIRPHITPEMTETYKQVITRIIADKSNELFELWKEASLHDEWVGVQKDLLKRIS